MEVLILDYMYMYLEGTTLKFKLVILNDSLCYCAWLTILSTKSKGHI